MASSGKIHVAAYRSNCSLRHTYLYLRPVQCYSLRYVAIHITPRLTLTLSFRSKRECTKWWVGCRYRQRKTRIISSLLLRCIRFWRIRMSITPHHSTSLKQAAKIPSVEEYLLPFGKRKCSLVPLAKQARGAKSLISSYLSRLDRSSLTDDLHGGCAQQRRR